MIEGFRANQLQSFNYELHVDWTDGELTTVVKLTCSGAIT